MQIFVIMGAAVMSDGNPSGAMRRRVEGALALAASSPHPLFIATGGRGRFGPPESDVMSDILRAAGVPAERIIAEAESADTLSSVCRCAHIVKMQKGVTSVIVCSDRYHIPRCRWLFWLLGVATIKGSMASGRKANGNLRWSYYYVRELFALPVDTFIVLFRLLTRNVH